MYIVGGSNIEGRRNSSTLGRPWPCMLHMGFGRYLGGIREHFAYPLISVENAVELRIKAAKAATRRRKERVFASLFDLITVYILWDTIPLQLHVSKTEMIK